jgi:ribosomal protein L32
MAVDSFFFVRGDKLPTTAEWQAALEQAKVGIVLDDVGEWYFGPLSESFGGDLPEGLGKRGHVVNCVTHGEMHELICGLIACSVLSQLADGAYLDEESGGLISADAALQIARRIESEEQDRKRRAAERDAASTSRRCPQCGSPCPEHRRTCKACGFEIGRAL